MTRRTTAWVKRTRISASFVVLLEGQTAPGLPFLRQLHLDHHAPTRPSEKDLARLIGCGRRAAAPRPANCGATPRPIAAWPR